MAGRLPNPDYERLIPAADSDRLYQQVCYEIRHADPAWLAAERNPLDLLAAALAEDPGDRDDIDRALAEDEFTAALLMSASADVRSQPLGSVATRTERILRWDELRTVAGSDKAFTAFLERGATMVTSNQEFGPVVELARKYQSGWRPQLGPLGSRPLVIRQPLTVPNMFFSPSAMNGGWPALHLRAATVYEVDPVFAGQADVSGREFHDRLAAFCTGRPLAGQIAALAETRGLDVRTVGWQPDPDATQFSRAAVQRLVLGPEGQPAAILRYAVFLPDNTGPMKLISDILISPTVATDAKWGRLGLEEVRDALAAGLGSSAGPLAAQVLHSIFGDTPPRTNMELYVWSAQGGAGDQGRPSNTLADTIDLEPLGPSTRPDQPPQQGLFAVAGDMATVTQHDYRYLSVHALIRMALDWGYLDAQATLLPLGS